MYSHRQSFSSWICCTTCTSSVVFTAASLWSYISLEKELLQSCDDEKIQRRQTKYPAQHLTLKNNQSLLSFLGLLELTRGRPCGMQVVVFLPSLWLQNITLLWSSLLILVPGNCRNSIIHLLPNPPKPTSHECNLLDLDCSRLLFRFSPQI